MRILLLLLVSFALFAQTPAQIQTQLNDATAQYNQAKKMFNPWYTGPLVTPAAGMMPPGSGNVQPYLFFNTAYAAFNEERKSIPLPHNSYFLQLAQLTFSGITDTVDCIATTTGTVNWQDHHTGGGFNDLAVTIGFLIHTETLYIPQFKFTIAETFPTGKYQNLSLNGLGLNSTGDGTYQTQFGLVIGKVIWWTYPHPINSRLFIGYNISTTTHVENFNTFGGGFHTRGVVRPGNTLTVDLGLEYSLTQRWVLALDTVYVAQNRTKFHGTPGILPSGLPASVGAPYNDNLSLAPAIEYNWNENLGIIWGVQFSVYGRSSQNFAKGQFSVTYTW